MYTFLIGLLLLALWHMPIFAGTYLTSDAAKIGIARGKGLEAEDSFSHGVGQVGVTYTLPDGTSAGNSSNGILLNPTTLLCTRHALEAGIPTLGSVIFYADTNFVRNAIEKARKAKEDLLTTILKDGSGRLLKDVVANLNLTTIQFHPTQDLAVVTLMWPLPTIPILPLALERPMALAPPGIIIGYMVSYSPTCVSGAAEAMHTCTRHVSTLDLREGRVPRSKDTFDTFLVKDCTINDGKLSAIQCVPSELFAFTNDGDSGAPFIIPGMGVLGLNYGVAKFITDGIAHRLMKIIPLYEDELKKWLLGVDPALKQYIKPISKPTKLWRFLAWLGKRSAQKGTI